MRRSRRLALALAVGAWTGACSPVHHVWQRADYQARPPAAAAAAAVKRVTVVAQEAGGCAGIGDVLGAVVGDLVKLRKNYLVLPPHTAQQHWAEGCGTDSAGVIFVQPLRCVRHELEVELQLAMELYRCRDGALLWRAEASGTGRSQDASLTELTGHYASTLGPRATVFGAPCFTLGQALVTALPDPLLDDAEVLQKIELGALLRPAPCVQLKTRRGAPATW